MVDNVDVGFSIAKLCKQFYVFARYYKNTVALFRKRREVGSFSSYRLIVGIGERKLARVM